MRWIMSSHQVDMLERMSRVLTLFTLGAAIIACLGAPIMALAWINRPFLGFLVDRTLVVTDAQSPGWSGKDQGIHFGQRVARVGGFPVTNAAEYRAVLPLLEVGKQVSVFVFEREGTARLYPAVTVMRFPARDAIRHFWVPYFVALGYLFIGGWTYRVRGQSRPGRALSFFCFCAGLTMALNFDAFTTYAGAHLWSISVALLGGALLSLAMRFPEESRMVSRHPWLLAIPYLVAFALGAWAALTLYDDVHPWAYLDARNTALRFSAVGAVIFLGMMVFRALAGQTSLVRQQARIVLVGSMVAFGPLMSWILLPIFGIVVRFNPVLHLPSLVLFPAAVAVAIFRYRLLEMDFIVNRTILWTALTGILAGLIAFSIGVLQRIFVAFTGEKSDIAIVLTAFILYSVTTPIKNALQSRVDRRYKEAPDNTRGLRQFGDSVRTFIAFSEADQVASRFLDEAAQALKAASGSISVVDGGRLRTVHVTGAWNGEAWLVQPLEYEGQRYGLLLLGPRKDGTSYSRQEFAVLQQTAAPVAQALYLAIAHANQHPTPMQAIVEQRISQA